MNYQELTWTAQAQAWAVPLKQKIDAENEKILADRQAFLDRRLKIGVGDFVLDGDKVLRIAHNWGDALQLTDGHFTGSFYLGDDFVEYSGSLDSAIPITLFLPTDEKRMGPVWFFSRNYAQAHNGYYTQASFRVWKLA